MKLAQKRWGKFRLTGFAVYLKLPPPYLSLMCGLLFSMTIIVMGALALVQLTRQPSNPFSDFSDLFARDARSAAIGRGFTCESVDFDSHHRPITDYCVMQLHHEMISQISLGLSGNYANEVNFMIRENKLAFGDLAALWGKPQFWQSREFVAATWKSQSATAIAPPPQNGHISYFLPVINVSFTRSGTRYWSLLYRIGKLSLTCAECTLQTPH